MTRCNAARSRYAVWVALCGSRSSTLGRCVPAFPLPDAMWVTLTHWSSFIGYTWKLDWDANAGMLAARKQRWHWRKDRVEAAKRRPFPDFLYLRNRSWAPVLTTCFFALINAQIWRKAAKKVKALTRFVAGESFKPVYIYGMRKKLNRNFVKWYFVPNRNVDLHEITGVVLFKKTKIQEVFRVRSHITTLWD